MNLSPSPSERKKLSIVIPITDIKGSKNYEQLTALLTSIEQGKISDNCNIVGVFDKCQENFIEQILDKYPFLVGIPNTRNRLHFARNSNLGLRYVHQVLKTDVVLCNQDCVLPAWEHFSKLVGKGIATPQSMAYYEGMDLNKVQAPEHKRIETREKFPFYCVFISKAVMDEIGYLDGVFCQPTFEDDDYLTRALLKGLTCEKTNVIIYHEGTHIDTSGQWESAAGSYTEEDLRINLRKYGTKYQVPQEIPHERMLEWILKNHHFTPQMAIW